MSVRPSDNGFTLLEMVLTITLLGLLAGIVTPIFSQGLLAANTSQKGLSAMAKARVAMERMVREIRQMDYSGSAYQLDLLEAERIRFIKNDAANTQVTLEKSATQVLLQYGANSSVLCDTVSNLLFRYLDIDGNPTVDAAAVAFVEISFAVYESSSDATLSQRTRVGLRDHA